MEFSPAGFLAAMAGFLMVFLVVMLIVYLYSAFALMAIAKKKNTPNAWLAFIPIANIYLMTQIAGLPAWYTAGIVLVFIPFAGQILFTVLIVLIWWKICEALSKPGWWGVLMIIPIVNFVIMGILAWGKD